MLATSTASGERVTCLQELEDLQQVARAAALWQRQLVCCASRPARRARPGLVVPSDAQRLSFLQAHAQGP